VQTSVTIHPDAKLQTVFIQKQKVEMQDTFIHFSGDVPSESIRRVSSAPTLSSYADASDRCDDHVAGVLPGAVPALCELLLWAPSTLSVFDSPATKCELQCEAAMVLQRFFRQRLAHRCKDIAEQINILLEELSQPAPSDDTRLAVAVEATDVEEEAFLEDTATPIQLSNVDKSAATKDNSLIETAPFASLPATLPMYLLRCEPSSDPLKAKIEACHYYANFCCRGDQCKYSHLQEVTADGIKCEFNRIQALHQWPVTVQPADPIQRVVLDAGKSAKEALQMHDIPVIGDRIKIDSNDPQIVINSTDLNSCQRARSTHSVSTPPKPTRRFSHTPKRHTSTCSLESRVAAKR
jgi:hypothetical protein